MSVREFLLGEMHIIVGDDALVDPRYLLEEGSVSGYIVQNGMVTDYIISQPLEKFRHWQRQDAIRMYPEKRDMIMKRIADAKEIEGVVEGKHWLFTRVPLPKVVSVEDLAWAYEAPSKGHARFVSDAMDAKGMNGDFHTCCMGMGFENEDMAAELRAHLQRQKEAKAAASMSEAPIQDWTSQFSERTLYPKKPDGGMGGPS